VRLGFYLPCAVLAALALHGCGSKDAPAEGIDPVKAKRIEPVAITGPAPDGMKKRSQASAVPSDQVKVDPANADRKKQRDQKSTERKKKKAEKKKQREEQAAQAATESEQAMSSLPPMPTGPYTNVLLITIDTMRADRMSCYGASRETTPTIDSVAKEGMIFDNAFAQRNSTWPSLATIMTSQYPIQHGVRHNGLRMSDELLTLAEHLGKHDYTSVAVFANATSQNWEGFQFRYPIDQTPVDERATHGAVKWLNEHKGRKFFMWLHYLAPHADYMPPAEFQKFNSPGYKGPIDGSKESVGNASLRRFDVTPADVQQVLDLYDGELLYVDNEIKKVLDVLKEQGVYDTTLVMISADHGEELNDHHDYYGHGASIYDGVLRVPLIARLPNVIPAGKRDATIVQHLTIAPTICEVAGVPVPESFVGKSLMPLARGEKVDYGPAYAEMKDEILTVRTAEYKFVANPFGHKPRKLNVERRRQVGIDRAGNELAEAENDGDVDTSQVDPELLVMQLKEQELYHVATDRLEQKELASEKPDVVTEMKKHITAFQEKYNWRFGHEVDERVQKEVAPELRQELEAMGYVM